MSTYASVNKEHQVLGELFEFQSNIANSLDSAKDLEHHVSLVEGIMEETGPTRRLWHVTETVVKQRYHPTRLVPS